MEETKFEKVYSAVRNLIKEQKMQCIKFSELEKKLDIQEKLSKRLEKALNDEKDQVDKRFDSVIDRFENLETVVEEHTDTIDETEKKSSEAKVVDDDAFCPDIDETNMKKFVNFTSKMDTVTKLHV